MADYIVAYVAGVVGILVISAAAIGFIVGFIAGHLIG